MPSKKKPRHPLEKPTTESTTKESLLLNDGLQQQQQQQSEITIHVEKSNPESKNGRKSRLSAALTEVTLDDEDYDTASGPDDNDENANSKKNLNPRSNNNRRTSNTNYIEDGHGGSGRRNSTTGRRTSTESRNVFAPQQQEQRPYPSWFARIRRHLFRTWLGLTFLGFIAFVLTDLLLFKNGDFHFHTPDGAQFWEDVKFASIPVFSILFTWYHVWLGLQMCFYPVHWKGIRIPLKVPRWLCCCGFGFTSKSEEEKAIEGSSGAEARNSRGISTGTETARTSASRRNSGGGSTSASSSDGSESLVNTNSKSDSDWIDLSQYRILGWQGIVPRRASTMAERSCDIMVGRLITVEEIIDRIKPDEFFDALYPVLRETQVRITKKVGEKYCRRRITITI